MWVGALQRLCSSGLYVSRGSRVSGGHFCLFTFFSFVPCYNNCSKIAFKFAQIYNYLVWTVTFEVTALKRKTGRGGLKEPYHEDTAAIFMGQFCS